jgi:hypothetical protein
VYFACFAIDVWERRRGWSDVQTLRRIYSDFGDRISFQRMGSNENKMSDGGLERASLVPYFLILSSGLSSGGPPFAPSHG